MLYVVAHLALLSGPEVILAVAGIILAIRYRNISTLLVACGFCLAAVSGVIGAYVSARYSVHVMAGGDINDIATTYDGWTWFTQDAGLAGFWLGATALLWYAIGLLRAQGHLRGTAR